MSGLMSMLQAEQKNNSHRNRLQEVLSKWFMRARKRADNFYDAMLTILSSSSKCSRSQLQEET